MVNTQHMSMMAAPAIESANEIFWRTIAIPETKPSARIKISGTLIKIAMVHFVTKDMVSVSSSPSLVL